MEGPVRIRISIRRRDDIEIQEMIGGRPQDDNYIYLDVDGEEEPADAAWSPKGRVVVRRSEGSSARPRRNKRRSVIDSCLANASAKLSSQESSQDEESGRDTIGDVELITSTAGRAEDGRRRRRNGGVAAASSKTRQTRKQVQPKREMKKGYRTAKQRLAQAIGLWKGVRS